MLCGKKKVRALNKERQKDCLGRSYESEHYAKPIPVRILAMHGIRQRQEAAAGGSARTLRQRQRLRVALCIRSTSTSFSFFSNFAVFFIFCLYQEDANTFHFHFPFPPFLVHHSRRPRSGFVPNYSLRCCFGSYSRKAQEKLPQIFSNILLSIWGNINYWVNVFVKIINSKIH